MKDMRLQRQLLFVLHRALVEARMLSQSTNATQLLELTDAIESIPSYMDSWEEGHLEVIRANLMGYRRKYPNASFDYVRYMDHEPPGRF